MKSRFSFFGILKYVCDIIVKSSRSLSHLVMSSCIYWSSMLERQAHHYACRLMTETYVYGRVGLLSFYRYVRTAYGIRILCNVRIRIEL